MDDLEWTTCLDENLLYVIRGFMTVNHVLSRDYEEIISQHDVESCLSNILPSIHKVMYSLSQLYFEIKFSDLLTV